MSPRNGLLVGYILYRRGKLDGKLLRIYEDKESLLKAISRIPLKKRLGLKFKRYVKFSLVK